MKTNKAHATTLHSRIVRQRINACQAHTHGVLTTPCHRSQDQSLWQCAHMLSRKFTETRTDLDNAWCLCARHHIVIDSNPDLWARLLLATHSIEHAVRLRNKIVTGPTIAGQPVSPLLFWRHEVNRIAQIAIAEQVDLTGIPKDIITKAKETQQ